MKKITKDQLWKAIIEELFEPFLHFFYPSYVNQIDFEKGFEFLEKELQSLYPKSESKNPFSIVMEMAWYALKKNKLSEEHYVEVGKKIVKKLVRKGFDILTIRKIVEFIRYYVNFENSEIFNKFNESINKTLKIENDMGILELVKKHKEAEIFEKGEKKGEKRGEKRGEKKIIQIIKFLKAGKTTEFIAKELDTTKKEVEDLRKIIE